MLLRKVLIPLLRAEQNLHHLLIQLAQPINPRCDEILLEQSVIELPLLQRLLPIPIEFLEILLKLERECLHAQQENKPHIVPLAEQQEIRHTDIDGPIILQQTQQRRSQVVVNELQNQILIKRFQQPLHVRFHQLIL